MELLTEFDRQHIFSNTTEEERRTIEVIMNSLDGYSFNQARKILRFTDAVLSTALVDSTRCASRFFEEAEKYYNANNPSEEA